MYLCAVLRGFVIPCAFLASCTRANPAWSSVEGSQPDNCSFVELSRHVATTPQGELFHVAPQIAAVSPSADILIAGTPSYVWRRDAAGRITDAVSSEDSIVATIITSHGVIKPVVAPLDGARIRGLRAVHRDSSVWSVVFGETSAPRRPTAFDSIVGLWHGVFNHTSSTWLSLERIPLGAARQLDVDNSSPLLQWLDSLAWSMRSRTHDGRDNVVVFLRGQRGWQHEILAEEFGQFVGADVSPNHELTVAVVHPNRAAQGGAPALFLYRRAAPAYRRLLAVSDSGQILPRILHIDR